MHCEGMWTSPREYKCSRDGVVDCVLQQEGWGCLVSAVGGKTAKQQLH